MESGEQICSGLDSLACDGFSTFYSFQLAHVVQCLLELDYSCVLGVHLKEIDQVRRTRAVEDTLFDQENRIAVGIAVKHRAAHTAAGAGAGDQ